MSHLGDRLSALVDGELDGAELDRVHAHLASCEQCRTEAAELRALKKKLRALMTGAPAEAAMTRRLIAMTGPGGPMPPRRRLLRVVPGHRPATGPDTTPDPADLFRHVYAEQTPVLRWQQRELAAELAAAADDAAEAQ
jgi:anti-sigma factor RsiW